MTRAEFEDKEGIAIAALLGLISQGGAGSPREAAEMAFDYAEALVAERQKRLGDKPGFND
ncbi:hypothetical protein OIU19_03465 [Pseudomonas sp. BT-42-2]|jgi:hypothetical protein|uniref:hypothetical protein n=1 Tax=Pseudomonas sp. BT-42-2 TaxID=2986927 RepID=UPI0021F7B54D|nr:hypothetical protein [Pseudomonas sp. BT-42-2]MCV9917837.1 hypothetical protein [Pseudomonas sp. BT-42-2]